MSDRPARPPRHLERLLLVLPVAAVLVAGVAVWTVVSSPSGAPTPRPSASRVASASRSPGASVSAAPAATPSPTVPARPIKSIVLVSAVGEDTAATPSSLAWQAIQDAGGAVGAKVSRVQPLSRADLSTGIAKAADDGAAIVVGVGPGARGAIAAAAGSHAGTQFILLGDLAPSNAPANVHSIVFDESEAGYIAGLVASSVSTSGTVGLVGNAPSDHTSGNYARGFANGAIEGNAAAKTKVAYAGRLDDPQRGGAAALSLMKGGSDVIVAMPGQSGDGALRAACKGKARVVALETEAKVLLPDVSSCLVASVLFHYDVILGDSIMKYVEGKDLPAVIMGDVASGSIGLSSFYQPVSQEIQDHVATVLDVLAAGPPRPTPAPPTPATTHKPATSTKP